MPDILLCSDLDRTILPNGAAQESPQARSLFASLIARPEVTLAYVSGRDLRLLKQAIDEYKIPVPDFAVGDVGTTIYKIHQGQWQLLQAWEDEIAPDWAGYTHAEIAALFVGLDGLRMQEPEKQNTYKLSYYTPPQIERDKILGEMQKRLVAKGIKASLIWSIDEAENVGLLDVLPEGATKLHAVRFLMRYAGFSEQQTVFAGDSGNDLPVLVSGLQSVLVRNAHPDVCHEADTLLATQGLRERLYIAQGDVLGMNGNYSAGVIEGVLHFMPQAASWLK